MKRYQNPLQTTDQSTKFDEKWDAILNSMNKMVLIIRNLINFVFNLEDISSLRSRKRRMVTENALVRQVILWFLNNCF